MQSGQQADSFKLSLFLSCSSTTGSGSSSLTGSVFFLHIGSLVILMFGVAFALVFDLTGFTSSSITASWIGPAGSSLTIYYISSRVCPSSYMLGFY